MTKIGGGGNRGYGGNGITQRNGAAETSREERWVNSFRRPARKAGPQPERSRANHKPWIFETCYRIDLIVEDKVVVELKSAAALLPVHQAQLLTYMALSDCPAGLLINFNVPRLVDGVKRLINPRASGRSRSGGSARVD